MNFEKTRNNRQRDARFEFFSKSLRLESHSAVDKKSRVPTLARIGTRCIINYYYSCNNLLYSLTKLIIVRYTMPNGVSGQDEKKKS